MGPLKLGFSCPACLENFSVLNKAPVKLECGHYVCYECTEKTGQTNTCICPQHNHRKDITRGAQGHLEIEETNIRCTHCGQNNAEDTNFQLLCNRHYICGKCLKTTQEIHCDCNNGTYHPAKTRYPKCSFIEKLREKYKLLCPIHKLPITLINQEDCAIYCETCISPRGSPQELPLLLQLNNRIYEEMGGVPKATPKLMRMLGTPDNYPFQKLLKETQNSLSPNPVKKLSRFTQLYPIKGRLPKEWYVDPNQLESIILKSSRTISLESIVLAGSTTPTQSLQVKLTLSMGDSILDKEYTLDKAKNSCNFDPITLHQDSPVRIEVKYPPGSKLYNGIPSKTSNPITADQVRFTISEVISHSQNGRNDIGGPILGWSFRNH